MSIKHQNKKYTRASAIVFSKSCKLYGHYTKFPPEDKRRLYNFTAARGIAVHDEISRPELYTPYNVEIPQEEETMSPESKKMISDKNVSGKLWIDKKNALHNYLAFMEDYEVQPIVVEKRYYYDIPYPICGRIDMLAYVKGIDLPVVIDFKYSLRKLKSHYDKALIYNYLLNKNDVLTSRDMWTVRLRGNSYKIDKYYYNSEDLWTLLKEYEEIDGNIELPNDLKIVCLICQYLPACPMFLIT